MIIGTGIDIVHIERVERMRTRWGDRFLHRLFTEREILYCQNRARSSTCYAARFAAKEAFLKAIGWGLRNGIQWTDIEVENGPMGKPYLLFHRKATEVFESLRIRRSLLTLSHDHPYAVAHVLLEGKDDEGRDS
jgi:holo-[acyl-carrier protein] synthase